jgi:internalin A
LIICLSRVVFHGVSFALLFGALGIAVADEKPKKSPARDIRTLDDLKDALVSANPGFGGSIGVRVMGPRTLAIAIQDKKVTDISPLAGLSIGALDLFGCNVSDISPLKGMPIRELSIEENGVTDISALEGMPLVTLRLNGNPVVDISPLAGAPLGMLYLVDTKVDDVSPLAKCVSLEQLWLNNAPVTDVTGLKDLPLISLTLAGTKVDDVTPLSEIESLERLHIGDATVTDISPLAKLPRLSRLIFTPAKIENGIAEVRAMKSLAQLGVKFDDARDAMPADAFWAKYDAGAFGTKKPE